MKLSLTSIALSAMTVSFVSGYPIPKDSSEFKTRRNLRSSSLRSTSLSCNDPKTLNLEFTRSQLVNTDNAVGKTQFVPINVPGATSQIPGTFATAVTDFPKASAEDADICVFNGLIHLDAGIDGNFTNQIVIQGTCTAPGNAVVGGLGAYEGIYGRQYFEKGSTNETIAVVVDYCLP